MRQACLTFCIQLLFDSSILNYCWTGFNFDISALFSPVTWTTEVNFNFNCN